MAEAPQAALPPGDPRAILNDSPMRTFQVVAVFLCFMLNALDGFDVLAITFAAPGIAEEWGVRPGAIGLIISMGLIGMVLGSFLLGPVADRIGRRNQILLSLAIMVVGMLASAAATSLVMLGALRVFTGIGLGAMIASINAMAAEYANIRRRDLAVSVMAAGYPAGAVVGGWASAVLMQRYGWESVFVFGGLATLALVPFVLAFLPESISFLARTGWPDALTRINRILRRMGHREATEILPNPAGPRPGMAALFVPGTRGTTIALIAMYSFHLMSFYYALGWVPSLVTSAGFDKSTATMVSVVLNMGGAIGGFTLGLLTPRFGLRPILLIGLFGSWLAVIGFGQVPGELLALQLSGFLVGFMSNGSVVGLYALIARAYPTASRASGTGIVIGAGRLGAATGPVIAGFLLSEGFSRSVTSTALATGSLLAGLTLLYFKIRGASESDLRDTH
jgi:benzoate transport